MNNADYYQVVAGPETQSALDGTFAIRLRRGQTVELRVSSDGYATTEVGGCQAGERVRVVLNVGATLEISARDEAGDPVEHVELQLWRRDDTQITFGGRDGVTDSSGRCRFNDLSPGSINVRAQHDVLGSPDWANVDVPRGGTATLELTMPTGRTVTGRVIDATTGRPIASARVGLGWTMQRWVETDPRGQYAMSGFTGRGTLSLAVDADGYGRQTKEVGDSSELDFALDPGDEAQGRVLDATGRRVGGALVTAVASQSLHGRQQTDSRSAVSDGDGAFHLDSLRRDLPHTLVVLSEGHGRYLLDFEPHPERPGVIDLGDVVLPEARAIEGAVTDEGGTPLRGLWVILSGHNADRRRLLPNRPPPRDFFYGRTEERRTDDLGRSASPTSRPATT